MIELSTDAVCEHSEGVVAREIEGEIIIVPLVSGIADAEDELYTLSETGKAVWQKLDGNRTLKDIVALLAEEFDAPLPDLEQDVLGFVQELTRRGMLSVKT
jgi:Coenzyme PQQ synthesis protein D (PqqD)